MVFAAVPVAPRCLRKTNPEIKRINIERSEEALATGATVIAANCPFCTTMLMDGVKNKEQEDHVQVLDIAEMVAQSLA